jgi:hypothetical protein
MAANPLPPNPSPNPDEKLVRVFDTEQESEALVVKALLESARIDSKISGIDTVQSVLPIGGTIILVREEDEPAARQLLEDYHRSPAQEAAEEALFDATAETAEYNTRPGDRPTEDRSIEDSKAEN